MKMLIGHLDLTTDTKNKLYNQTTKIENILNKQKEVLDKIKEWVYHQQLSNENLEPYISTDKLDEILEILEEIK